MTVYVPRGATSRAIGQKKRNKTLLINSLGISDVVFSESCDVEKYDVHVTLRKDT